MYRWSILLTPSVQRGVSPQERESNFLNNNSDNWDVESASPWQLMISTSRNSNTLLQNTVTNLNTIVFLFWFSVSILGNRTKCWRFFYFFSSMLPLIGGGTTNPRDINARWDERGCLIEKLWSNTSISVSLLISIDSFSYLPMGCIERVYQQFC